jgi:hypothetical protein
MHMNMYLFFENLNILCIFSDRFFDPVFFWFFSGSGSVPVFGVDRFDDRFGSCNIGTNFPHWFCNSGSYRFLLHILL